MQKGAGIAGIIFASVFLFVGLTIGVTFGVIGGMIRSEGTKNQEIVDEYVKHGEKTKGKIVSADNGTTIEYEDEDGEEYLIHYNVTSSEFYQGQKVTVYYDEDYPENGIAPDVAVRFNKTFGSIFLFVGIGVGGVFGFIGLTALIAGIVAIKKAPKGEQSSSYVSSGAGYEGADYTATFGNVGNNTPTVSNDIPVSVSVVGESGKRNLSGVDKNLL